MYNNAETLLNYFGETAHVCVNVTYSEFLISIKHIDRLKNENSMQLWIGKYMDKLKQRLDGKALEYIATNRDIPTIDWFQKKLMYMINSHLQEFNQMVRYV